MGDGNQDDSAVGKSMKSTRYYHKHDNDEEGSSSHNDDGTANKRPKRYEHEKRSRKHKKHHMKEKHFEEEDGDSDEEREEDKDKKVKKSNMHAKHKHVSHRNARKKHVKKKRKKKKKFKIKKKKKHHIHKKSKLKHTSRHIIMPPDDGSGERRIETNEDVISGEGNDEDANGGNTNGKLAKRNTIIYPSQHKQKKSHKHHVPKKKKGKKVKHRPNEDEMSEDAQIVREIPNNVEMLDFKPRDDSIGQINDEKMTELPWQKSLNDKESVAKSQVDDEDNNITPISPNETFGDITDSDYGSTDMGDFEIPHTENLPKMPKTPMMDEEEGSALMTIPNIDDKVVHHSKHADKKKEKQKHKHTDKHKVKHKMKEHKKKMMKKKM